ncbi:hypothetical protein [Corynebacterium callunae]|nr:hypothetical protein [Corynebacterium callunae]MCK2199841.1 hypothetical protein [Corynebacterium callunae]
MNPQVLPRHQPLVAQSRGDLIESIHYGSAILLDADGSVAQTLGDP